MTIPLLLHPSCHPSHLHPSHLHPSHLHLTSPPHISTLHISNLHSLPGADLDDSTVKKTATIVLPRERNVSFGFTISGKKNAANYYFCFTWLHPCSSVMQVARQRTDQSQCQMSQCTLQPTSKRNLPRLALSFYG